MTTTTVTNPEIQPTYEPTVADKIQRVLYRLENDGELISGFFREDDNFCVMGLFADESKIGKWAYYGDSLFDYLVDDQGGNPSIIKLCEYYNMNELACFELGTLEPDLQNEVRKIMETSIDFSEADRVIIGLTKLNDVGVSTGCENINEVLAAVIRSGAVFKG